VGGEGGGARNQGKGGEGEGQETRWEGEVAGDIT